MTELAVPSRPPDHIGDLIQFTQDWWKETLPDFSPASKTTTRSTS